MSRKLLILLCGDCCGSCGIVLRNLLILLNTDLRKSTTRSLRIYSGSRALAARHPDTIQYPADLLGGVA